MLEGLLILWNSIIQDMRRFFDDVSVARFLSDTSYSLYTQVVFIVYSLYSINNIINYIEYII